MLPDVTVSITKNGVSDTPTLTDADGMFEFLNLDAGATYVITPTKSHWTFAPIDATFIDLGSDQGETFKGTLNKWGVAGKILEKGVGIAAVTVSITKNGVPDAPAITVPDGTYEFLNLDAGATYVLTPEKNHYVFEPVDRTLPDLCGNVKDADFSGTVAWTISGTVLEKENPIPDVEILVTMDGSPFVSKTTDADGKYLFNVYDESAAYIITPTKVHWTFMPEGLKYDGVTGNITDADFAGKLNKWAISGTITDGVNPISDVTVDLTGASTATLTTSATGYYSFPAFDAGATYTVTPTKGNWTFAPENATFVNLDGNKTQNFTGTWNQWAISGTITDGAANPIPDVTVSLTIAIPLPGKNGIPYTTTTDGNGNYALTNLDAGATYTITPTRTHWTFTPVDRTYPNLSNNITDADFIGTKDFAENLENVIVYPNPYKPDGGVDAVTFANLAENTKIQIYNVTGELIFEVKATDISYPWYLINQKGKDVASGVYLYIISNAKGEKKIGKFVIIR
jgi:hypothetical protein